VAVARPPSPSVCFPNDRSASQGRTETVDRRADADRDVDPGVDQIDRVLGDDEIERDLGKAGPEFGQRRHQRAGGEGRADADAHPAARLLAEAHDVGLRIRDLADDALIAVASSRAGRDPRSRGPPAR
jgi:hypothetical protein